MTRTVFIDDRDVTLAQGVRRVIHPASKFEGNPVVQPVCAWENRLILGGTVRWEADGYRMWYQSYGHGTYLNLYATSQDGSIWERPDLGQYEDFTGSEANNIFLSRLALRSNHRAPLPVNQDHIPNVLYTPHQGRDRTYTLFAYDYGRSGYVAYDGFVVAYSRDGIAWTDGPANPVIPGHADVGWFMYDEADGKFRATVKQMLAIRGHRRRSVLATESLDGLDWTLPKPAIVPDEQDDAWAEGIPTIGMEKPHTQFYGMPIFRYESVLIGFLQIFRVMDTQNRSHDGPVDLRLTVSRDGKVWHNVGDRQAILELGPTGAWDAGGVYGGNALVWQDDEVRLYYSGASLTHGHPGENAIGLASWPRDRLVGLRAGAGRGMVQTTTHRAGRHLHLNVNASGGEMIAEVVDQAGQVLDGYQASTCRALRQDTLDHGVTWQGDAAHFSGRPVSVRVYLTNAELFSLWWD